MLHLVKTIAYVAMSVAILTGLSGCDNANDVTTERVSLEIVWTNSVGKPLYISSCKVKPVADVVCSLTDTVIAPGESLAVAAISREVSFSTDGEKEAANAAALEALVSAIEAFDMKYVKNGVLHRVSHTAGKGAFVSGDYGSVGNRFELPITEELIEAAGATEVEGVERNVTIQWEIKTSVPFTLKMQGSGVELDKRADVGDVLEVASIPYREYAGEEAVTADCLDSAVSRFVESVGKMEIVMQNVVANTADTTFGIEHCRDYVFDIERYAREGDVYTLSVYNETLLVEFDFMRNDNCRRTVHQLGWKNGMGVDMSIDLQFREHQVVSIGKTHFSAVLAPGEVLQLNPLIVYHEEGVNYVRAQEDVAWDGFVAEIESLRIEYGDKEYVLDKENPAEFIDSHRCYADWVYLFAGQSFK